MAAPSGNGRELQQNLNRLADLLSFRERFMENPHAALEDYGLTGLPNEAVEAIASLSPDELRLFAEVQHKLGTVTIGEEENCLLF